MSTTGEIAFTVQGAEPEPYRVRVARDGARVMVSCTCAAARNGGCCRHQLAALGRPVDGLLTVRDRSADLTQAARWIENSPIRHAIAEWERSKNALVEAKQRLATANRALAAALHASATPTSPPH